MQKWENGETAARDPPPRPPTRRCSAHVPWAVVFFLFPVSPFPRVRRKAESIMLSAAVPATMDSRSPSGPVAPSLWHCCYNDTTATTAAAGSGTFTARFPLLCSPFFFAKASPPTPELPRSLPLGNRRRRRRSLDAPAFPHRLRARFSGAVCARGPASLSCAARLALFQPPQLHRPWPPPRRLSVATANPHPPRAPGPPAGPAAAGAPVGGRVPRPFSESAPSTETARICRRPGALCGRIM